MSTLPSFLRMFHPAESLQAITNVVLLSNGTVLLAMFVLAISTLTPLARGADDVTFHKTRYSSVKQPTEADVSLPSQTQRC